MIKIYKKILFADAFSLIDIFIFSIIVMAMSKNIIEKWCFILVCLFWFVIKYLKKFKL